LEILPVTLEGNYVRLVPMSVDHFEELCEVGFHDELWRFMPTPMRNREDMREYILAALRFRDGGTALPFVTMEKAGNKVVGSTRFLNIERAHRRLEIGSTWITPKWQRTQINTETKYLMLRHAFEVLHCVRVEFKTDSLNEQSRNALARIGAKEEGTLRNHMIMPDGRLRHSVYYSFIDNEWGEVKTTLEAMIPRTGV
jgi:RimJ/RimL family protein N-acetyltransferase